MKPVLVHVALLLALSTSFANAGAIDRISARTDDTRAKAEGRYNRVGTGQTGTQETIVEEETPTEPVKRAAPKRAAPKRAASRAVAGDMIEIAQPEIVKPAAKRTVPRRRVETVTRPAPLKINPY